MTGQPPLLEIENLSVSYFTRAGEVPAVIDASLTLMAGESVGLVGESGCGKSTLAMAILRHLGGNGRIVGGTVRYKGRDLATLSGKELRRLRGGEIAMIYQEPAAALNPSLTIGTQLREVPMVHDRVARAEAHRRAIAILEDVRLSDPERILAAYPHQLSGGQQQRAVIAMALLGRPSLLLLDEPTTALDVTVEAGIVQLIRRLGAEYGTAQLYISHNLGLIRQTCQRVCILYAGAVVEKGPVEAVFRRPLHPYTRGLFQCIPLPGADKTARPLSPIPGQLPLPHQRPPGCHFHPRCGHARAGLCDRAAVAMEAVDGRDYEVRCLRWRELEQAPAAVRAPRPASSAGETVLSVEALQKHYPVRDRSLAALISGKRVRWLKANEQLSFEARHGETVAIVGESGCGKSTFAKVLVGLETATSGDIRFGDAGIAAIRVRRRSPDQLRALQMVFQDPDQTLNPSHSIGAQIARVIRKFAVERDPAKVRERVRALLAVVKLPPEFARRKPRQLSGGQKQRVGIARAFAGQPRLVVADEPISALDVSVAAAITELLMDIQHQHGTTLLFISHDLATVRYLADRIVVMYLGTVVEQGTTAEVFAPPYHPYTEALLSAVPLADPGYEKREILLDGAVPSALDPPRGCPFSTRCPRRVGPICDEQPPPRHVSATGHAITCHIPPEELAAVAPVFRAIDAEAAE